jgi:hypothetical protein
MPGSIYLYVLRSDFFIIFYFIHVANQFAMHWRLRCTSSGTGVGLWDYRAGIGLRQSLKSTVGRVCYFFGFINGVMLIMGGTDSNPGP